MQMLKTLGRGIALATVAVVMTAGVGQAAGKFTVKKLKGQFLFQVQGFILDANDDFGEVVGAGLLTFDGSGNVSSADLQFSGADSSGFIGNGFDNFTCAATLGSGTDTVNSDGTGTLTLAFSGGSACFPSGSISFFFVLNRGTGENKIISTTFSPGLTVPTAPDLEEYLGMVLSGQFLKRKKGFVDPP